MKFCRLFAGSFDRVLGLSKDGYHLGADHDPFPGQFADGFAAAGTDGRYLIQCISNGTPSFEGVHFFGKYTNSNLPRRICLLLTGICAILSKLSQFWRVL